MCCVRLTASDISPTECTSNHEHRLPGVGRWITVGSPVNGPAGLDRINDALHLGWRRKVRFRENSTGHDTLVEGLHAGVTLLFVSSSGQPRSELDVPGTVCGPRDARDGMTEADESVEVEERRVVLHVLQDLGLTAHGQRIGQQAANQRPPSNVRQNITGEGGLAGNDVTTRAVDVRNTLY